MSHIFVPQDEIRILKIEMSRKELQNWLKTVKSERLIIEIQMKYAMEPTCFDIKAKPFSP